MELVIVINKPVLELKQKTMDLVQIKGIIYRYAEYKYLCDEIDKLEKKQEFNNYKHIIIRKNDLMLLMKIKNRSKNVLDINLNNPNYEIRIFIMCMILISLLYIQISSIISIKNISFF